MPINGGTRMLRARRKDINIKPNRRLDRKSSRGMLFENEELRMRTITINAEVEQGQHALKKLRRENEQLRREMWSLRDEYDKMEKLLRKKETDEDSDQENSYSDENYSQSEESDEDKPEGEEGNEPKEENPDLENEENLQKSSKFGNLTNARTFDGLSVIDEQTEETTQTTESAPGYTSRGNSANRTVNPPGNVTNRMYDEACGGGTDLQPFAYEPGYPKNRRKGMCAYENGSQNQNPCPSEWTLPAPCEPYGTRPSSPYPHSESVKPSYEKQFQVLQQLPPASAIPGEAVDENGWVFPDPGKMAGIPYPDYGGFSPADGYLPDKPVRIPDFRYGLVQDRTGPDLFVTGVYPETSFLELQRGVSDSVINNVEAEIDKIEISRRTEEDPKNEKMTILTRSVVSQSGAGFKSNADATGEEERGQDKLTMAAAVDNGDKGTSKHVEDSVPCQNPNHQDVREIHNQTNETGEDMPRFDRPNASKFQSKLLVTLKTPAKPEPKTSKKPAVPAPRTFQPIRYGIRPEFQTVNPPRFQTFPRFQVPNGKEGSLPRCIGSVSHERLPVPPAAATRPFNGIAAKTDNVLVEASDIPAELVQNQVERILPEADTVPVAGGQPKPVKIPPAPPPRSSSCPGTTIPTPAVGVTALHHRAFRKGKSPSLPSQFDTEEPSSDPMNPLLLSEPVATSSPTIRHKESQSTPRLRKQSSNNTNEESSTEDVTARRSRPVRGSMKLTKSPSFGNFRMLRRKQSEISESSVEAAAPVLHNSNPLVERKISRSHNPLNNVSISSSSGLDSPTKSDRRKRRVSIKFNKKPSLDEERQLEENRKSKESVDSQRESVLPSILTVRGSAKHRKSRNEETDATTSERERTNSVSSRTSSVAAGSGRRKFSVSSNRTYLNEEKIPWCGCWGNGCV